MISEIDIKDWENEFEKVKEAVDNMDDYARMADINPIGAKDALHDFIDKVETFIKQQTKHIPALLKP